jgi:transglutaminase-like putative cysteine protease
LLHLEVPAPLAGPLADLLPGMPMAAASRPIPEGDAGTAATIEAMRQLIDEGKKDPVVHELAANILRQARVRAFDWPGEVRAIYAAVKRNVRFTRDIRGKETLHSAREIIRLQIGDCDDFTILLCALLETVGVRTRIKTIAGDGRAPEVFTHVFPEASVNGKWIAVDAARRQPALGRQPRNAWRTRVWDTQSSEYQDIEGLAGTSQIVGPRRVARAWSPKAAAWTRGLQGPAPRRRTPLGIYAYPRGRRMPGMPASSYGAPHGQGHYGARALRGLAMGQDDDGSDFDWSQLETELPSLITAGTQGAASIIKAGQTPNAYSLLASMTPAQQQAYLAASSGNPFASISSSTWLLLGGVGLVAVFMMRSQGGN